MSDDGMNDGMNDGVNDGSNDGLHDDGIGDADESAGDGSSGDRDDGRRQGTGWLAVAMSVGAGLLGVQSSKNRTRDFTEGKPLHFIVGGLIGTLLFLVAIWLLVQYLIATS